jgi:hypothetical protein
MAITLVDRPYKFTALKQKLIFTATSSQVGQPGFRFVAQVSATVDGNTTMQTVYIQPNLNGAMVLDVYPIVKDFIDLSVTDAAVPNLFMQDTVYYTPYTDLHNIVEVTVNLYDGYEVLGVFTVNPLSLPVVRTRLSLINAAFQISQGYNPDPNLIFALSGPTMYQMTDLTPDVYDLSTEISTYSLGANTIGIRARFNSDYGVMTIPIDDGTRLTANLIDEIQVIQFNSAGAPIQTDSIPIAPQEGYIVHAGIYPANVSGSLGYAANMHHYLVNFLYLGSATARSIAFFQAEDECRFDTYRLAWINSRGGWDFWNFTKRSEQNYSIERKRFRKVIGNYATANANFSFNTYDRGLTERGAFVEKMLTVSTDFLSEAQFEFLKGLSYSDSVYIIDDSGIPTPVNVENTNFAAIKNRSYIKEGTQLTINLKYSQEYNV